MHLQVSLEFDTSLDEKSRLATIPAKPAVFALFPAPDPALHPPPYIGRTVDLKRRLGRLLAKPGPSSKLLNLHDFTRRIEFQCVGTGFEAQWLLYRLNRAYFPGNYRQRLRLKPPALLKLNLRNRFPRCYPTRRLSGDGSLYYGPFPSRAVAERFAAEFLDLFLIRRCVEDLDPDPSHPGCIYSQMKMCLAPCFAGCTDAEYQEEVSRVISFLDGEGQPLVRGLQAERTQASEALEFERAAKVHRRIEKVQELLRLKPGIVRNLSELHAVMVARGAEANRVVFFRVSAGELRGPVTLSFDENVASPVPLDEQIHNLLNSLGPRSGPDTEPKGVAGQTECRAESGTARPPQWEHLSLLARWYYSSFREGELLMLPASQEIPHARLIRLCRKILASESSARAGQTGS
jgi:excinuclease UvrABC nuclease subunit